MKKRFLQRWRSCLHPTFLTPVACSTTLTVTSGKRYFIHSIFYLSINIFDNQVTGIHLAAGFSSTSVVKGLVMAGADIHICDQLMHTPLHYAAHHNHLDVVTMVLKLVEETRPEQPNQMFQSFMEFAFNKPTKLQELLLLAATGNPNVDVLNMLISIGADVKATNEHRDTPLHMAAGYNPNIDMIIALVEAGADVDARDNANKTPLHKAAQHNPSLEVAKALVGAGADVNAVDVPQLTRYASINKGVSLVSRTGQLVLDGQTLGAKVICSTPLHMAARSNPTMVDTLLECGAKVNPKDEDFCTPLYYAAANNHQEAVISLCKAGAKLPRLKVDTYFNVSSEMKNLIKEHTQ